MKSAREPKLKTYISSNLTAWDSRSGKRSNSKSERNSILSTLRRRVTSQSQADLTKRVIVSNLKKYNSTPDKFYAKITNDIIYDEKKHLVCLFKDYLLWDEYSDFLKRFYMLDESIQRIPGYCSYYSKYSVMRPVYFRFNSSHIMYKNFKKHRKYFELIEENEERLRYLEENPEPNEFSKLIKSNMIDDKKCEESNSHSQYQNTKNSLQAVNVGSTGNYLQNKDKYFYNQNSQYDDLRYDYSNDDIFLDHFNNSNNFSLYSQFNRLLLADERDNYIEKNNRDISKHNPSNKNKEQERDCNKKIKSNINTIKKETITNINPGKNNIKNEQIILNKNKEKDIRVNTLNTLQNKNNKNDVIEIIANTYNVALTEPSSSRKEKATVSKFKTSSNYETNNPGKENKYTAKDDDKVALIIPSSLQSNSNKIDSSNSKTFKKIEIAKLDLKDIHKYQDNNYLANDYNTAPGLSSKLFAATTRNKPYLNPISNSKLDSTKTAGNSPSILPSPQNKTKLLTDRPAAIDSTVSIDHFNLKTVINTNDIKKRLNLVENVVKKLKDNHKESKPSSKQNNNFNSQTNINNNINTNNNLALKNSKSKGGSNTNLNIVSTSNNNPVKKSSKMLNTIHPQSTTNILKNNIIKSNTDQAKNMFNENTNNLVNKYFGNNIASSYTHLKTNSSNTNNNNNNIDNNNSQQSSVYNINLNLNLNVNLNMLDKNKSKAYSNSSKEKLNSNNTGNVASHAVPPSHALTERPSMNYNNTVTSSKIDKLLEKTEKLSMANIKANEKYKKLSRNMNVKNFILNYGSASANSAINNLASNNLNLNTPLNEKNISGKKSKNLVININNHNSNTNQITNPSTNINTVPVEQMRNEKIESLNNINVSKLSSNTPKNAKNNFNLYYKKFISSNQTGSSASIANTLTESPQNKRSSAHINTNKVLVDNYKYNPNSNTLSYSNFNNFTSNNLLNAGNNTFNQRNVVVNKNSSNSNKSLATSRDKKPLSISLKKNQFEKIREIVNKYPLTSRNEKESIKIFNNI